MSEPKIAREVAEAEVSRWVQCMEASLAVADREKVVLAVMAGRVSLNAETETFTLHLRKPLRLENGSSLAELMIQPPTFRQSLDAARGKTEAETALNMVGAVTGQATGVIERLPQKEINLAGVLIGFFA